MGFGPEYGLSLIHIFIGTLALEDPARFAALCHACPGRIGVSLDAENGRLKTRGWVGEMCIRDSIKGGQAVRLRRGRADDSTVFSDDPVAAALQWQEQGAKFLHLVDLDGAFEGEMCIRDRRCRA